MKTPVIFSYKGNIKQPCPFFLFKDFEYGWADGHEGIRVTCKATEP